MIKIEQTKNFLKRILVGCLFITGIIVVVGVYISLIAQIVHTFDPKVSGEALINKVLAFGVALPVVIIFVLGGAYVIGDEIIKSRNKKTEDHVGF